MSLSQSMNIALGSMHNNQYALTVVSQNIANLNVEGYHRQRVNFETNPYTTDCENVLSTIKGMNGASIASLSDFLDRGAFNNLLDSNSASQYYNTLNDALGQLEDIADDLGDNGINALLNDFYKASADLEKFPTDMAIRQQFVLSAQNICDKFNQVSQKYDDLQEDKYLEIDNTVNVVNSLLAKLASANGAHVSNNQSSSTQTDIDETLKELSNYVDITTEQLPNGAYNFYIGETAVVQGSVQTYTLQAAFDSTNPDSAVTLSLKSTENPDYVITKGVNDSIKGGALSAYLGFLNGSGDGFTNINDMRNTLNSAASAFANELNRIQTYNDGNSFAAYITTDPATNDLILSDQTPPALFNSKDGNAINASNIQVNKEILEDPFLVSAARITKDENGNLAADWFKGVGNSDNAVAFTNSKNAKICSYNGGANNCTLSDYLTNTAAKNGLDKQNIAAKADTYQTIADGALDSYVNLTGVNLDEELSDMIKYQRAYEASAKIFSTANNLMDVILAMA